ncbi:glycosyltransferase family 1 protein [Mucilaginibacter terrigena]|uniref:Glycosyltransferase family 1 protein n=1 Tax=Mucilaginibacter terrigena TaxID=2492395 RepID=A0A4V1ZBT0_9SPHI|nr:glycosyltransferase family 1 protein [Mucilaginibacter terrigena]RYU90230.1 glycosyltransferase family 1 protein [Mucilaginibacter terrigena]
MKIGYDAKRAFLNSTGLGNYSRWLIKLLASRYPQNTYYLYSPKIRPGKWPDLLRLIKNVITILPKPGVLTSLWRTKGVVKNLSNDGIDIYHGLSHELPLGITTPGIKSVVTIHDLIFMRFPQYFGLISRAIYKLKVAYACKTANIIIAISQKTKQDLVELLDIAPDKIEVVYQNCDEIFKAPCSDEKKQEIIKKYNLPGKFILSVGTIEERKNLGLLIEALPLINDIKVVVVGRHTAYASAVKAQLAKLNITNQVVFLDKVEFADLPVIYQLADVFVYPSKYEGFGIPVLEALNSGVPVIAATGSCLEEAGGPGSLYVNPDDAAGLAEKIALVLTDNPLREKMIADGKEYSRNFDDDKLAAQMMHLYKNLSANA